MLPREIQKILDQQGLELIEVLQRPDTKRRRFFSLRVHPFHSRFLGDEDLVLKVFGRGDLSVISGFEKEVGFLQRAAESGNAELGEHLPQFLVRGNGGRPWYLRECLEGEFLGDICLDFGIKKEFLTPALKESFLSFFSGFRSFSDQLSGTDFFFSLSQHGYDWYRRDLAYYRAHIESVSSQELDSAIRVLEGQRSLLDRGARFLVHGDLYLKNMFWSSGLGITDWELLHRGNLAFDAGFIWALSWRDFQWRDEFLSGFREGLSSDRRQVLAGLLVPVQTSLLLRFIRHSEIMLNRVLSETQKEARANAQLALESHQRALREILVL